MKQLNDLDIKRKKYIIFDMDGTLIDSIGVWNLTDKKLIKKYGNLDLDEAYIQKQRDEFLHNNQDKDIYIAYCNYLIKKYSLSVNNMEELLKIRLDISGEILTNEIDYKPGSVDLIFKLKELGFTIILATMTTHTQLDIYSHKNKKMSNKMNIYGVFDYITTEDDVEKKKPNPEIYEKILSHYGATGEECLIFEDSYTGILASNNAGIEVVNVYDKYADVNREEIDKITDYKIKDFKEFINFIENIYSK